MRTIKKSPSTSNLWQEKVDGPQTPARDTEEFLFSSTASPAKKQFIATSQKEVNPIQHYETTDIFLGAFLLSSGGDLSGINFNERHIATFMFTGKGLHQLDRDYMKGRALVNPVHLRESLNHLRDILFEMKDRRGKINAPKQRA